MQVRLVAEESVVIVAAERVVPADEGGGKFGRDVCIKKILLVDDEVRGIFQPEKVKAGMKNGILTLTIPKLKKMKK